MSPFRFLLTIASAFLLFFAYPGAQAAVCSPAASQGAAPASWQSYCWLDFSSYNDATARSTAGQPFSFNLSDGSVLGFRVRTTSSAATGMVATSAPSWAGAAVGNTSFIGIPGSPILYTANGGSLVTLAITAITITPPPGVAAVSNYAFVVADGESTDGAEYLNYTTDGSAWALLDSVAPISGNTYPALTGIGTTTARSSGGGNGSPIGAHIVGSNKPTSVTVNVQSGGLQGVMFAVRFASIKLTKTITGGRVNAADQFTFNINSTSSGAALATGTTTGTSNGPFTAAVISSASGIPITLAETMASGSVSTLSKYISLLTCTNATAGSPTVMPTNVATTSYSFGALSFGDLVSCTFSNTAYPHVTYSKALSATGRIFASDQFTIRVQSGATNVASATTTGAGTTVTNGSTGQVQLAAGTSYTLDEVASGSTVLSRYSKALSCSNAYTGSPTVLPTGVGVAFTPVAGDIITCTLTNTRAAANAFIDITKTVSVVSDPVNGTTNPKAIPGAVMAYAITVTNQGDLAVDANSLVITDVMPANLSYNGAQAVTFANGTTVSGLSAFNAATMARFSSQVGGGAPFTYTPANGFDPAVTGIQIRPQGTMAASTGVPTPSFTLRFQAQVK